MEEEAVLEGSGEGLEIGGLNGGEIRGMNEK